MPKLCGGEGQLVFLPWWNIQPGQWRIVLQGHIPFMTETESNVVWELKLLIQILKVCVRIQVCVWIGWKCPSSSFTFQTDMTLISRNFSSSRNSVWSHRYHKIVQGLYEREKNVNVTHMRGLILGIYCDTIVQCLLSCYPRLRITAHPWPWRLQWCRVMDAASCRLMLLLPYCSLGSCSVLLMHAVYCYHYHCTFCYSTGMVLMIGFCCVLFVASCRSVFHCFRSQCFFSYCFYDFVSRLLFLLPLLLLLVLVELGLCLSCYWNCFWYFC